MRKAHKLLENKACFYPQNIVYFDVETYNKRIDDNTVQPLLRLGWACYVRKSETGVNRNKQWLYFEDVETFWNFVDRLLRGKIKLYLVAHNIGFDFRVVRGFSHAKHRGWELKSFYVKGKTTLIKFTHRGNTIQLVDNTNFFPTSLKSLGQALGLEKLEIDFETMDNEKLSEYCKRDVEIMCLAWENWLEFIRQHDLGSFRVTLPAQAFTAYRHRFMVDDIFIHDNEEVCSLERQSYHGGRSECFQVGQFTGDTYYQLDVNSMYGWVMSQHCFPTELRGYRKSISIEGAKHKLRHFAVIARVKVTTNLPVFPIKGNNRLIYPVGMFETVLTTPELKYAFANDMILEVLDFAWYKQSRIFRCYSLFFHSLKSDYQKQANKPFRYISKLFINALYGKFGQRGIKQRMLGNSDNPNLERIRVYNPKTGQESVIFTICGKVIEHYRQGESYNSFPGIASHVTAYARLYLWRLMQRAGRENIYICDTDGFITNSEGFNNLRDLLHPYELGRLKIEKVAETLEVRAPKDYRLGNKERIKGIRKNAIVLSENTYQQDKFLGLRGMIQSGIPDYITIARVEKHLKRKIYSGIVTEQGRVIPFALS